MTAFNATEPVGAITFEAVVIRADGTTEDRGLIAYWYDSKWKMLKERLHQKVRWLMSNGELGATVIVNGGHAIVTNRMIGSGTEPKYIGWGTSAGTAAATDSTLFGEKLVDLTTAAGTDHTTGTSSRTTTTNTNDTYQVVGTRTATGAGSVTNAGTFDAASGGNLYVKGDFTSIGLSSGDSIAFTISVKYS